VSGARSVRAGVAALALVVTAAGLWPRAALAQRPGPPPGPPLAAKQAAVIDITGNWVALVNEDWRWRMMTAPIGDVASVPVNDAGVAAAKAWDPAKDVAAGDLCKGYGAAGLMSRPTRLQIHWTDDNTLQVDLDAGMQKRVFHFGAGQPPAESSLQGYSVANWFKQEQRRGFRPPYGGAQPGKGGSLKVMTTHLKASYLRRNGVPYSEGATLTEFYDRIEDEGTTYLILTSVVKDPKYLRDQFVTSYQYKLEPDASKWNPQPCKVVPPTGTGKTFNAFGNRE
jgi:hypothetical protein